LERALKYWAFLLLLCMPTSAFAQERPVPMRVNGEPGLWFPLEQAREVIAGEAERQSLLRRVSLLDETLTLAHQEIDALRLANASTDAARQMLGEQLAEAQRRAQDATAWYRDPVLWGGLGLAVGIILVTVIAVAIGGA
jgi:hypothetical protein